MLGIKDTYICKKQLKNKEQDFRLYELIPNYELLKEKARTNLLSPEGIEIRINRSIQVEGTFGQIKQNMNYDRIRRRGLTKVSCEIMLMCLGKNVRKIFSFIAKKELHEIILFHDSPFSKVYFLIFWVTIQLLFINSIVASILYGCPTSLSYPTYVVIFPVNIILFGVIFTILYVVLSSII